MKETTLEEAHHRLFGRPWLLGRYHFDFLREQGLRRTDRVLDYGCGSGRTGIHLIRYLDPGKYVGVDPDMARIEAFATYEVALHGLHDKDPTILAGVTPPGPPGDFDVVLDLFVIAHLRGGARAEAEKRVKAALRSGGLLARLGIKPVTHTTPAPAFTGTRWGDKLRWNLWRKP